MEHQLDVFVAPLTHTLPLVCKRWKDLVGNSDILWMPSIQRVVYKYPNMFKEPLLSYLKFGKSNPPWSMFYDEETDRNDYVLSSYVRRIENLPKQHVFILVSNIYESLSVRKNHHYNANDEDLAETNSKFVSFCAKDLYMTIIKNHTYVTVPVISMLFKAVPMGDCVTMTLFDTRYIIFIREALAHHKRPRLIVSNRKEIRKGDQAILAEVCKYSTIEVSLAKIKVRFLRQVELYHISFYNGTHHDVMEAKIKRFQNNV